MRRFVWRATSRPFHTLDLGDRKDRHGRRSHARSVTPDDGHRRDDPLAHHDAARAGIGELARPQRLQSADVGYLVRRDDNASGTGIHHYAVAARAERDAQTGHLRDVLKRTGRVYVGKVRALVIVFILTR